MGEKPHQKKKGRGQKCYCEFIGGNKILSMLKEKLQAQLTDSWSTEKKMPETFMTNPLSPK